MKMTTKVPSKIGMNKGTLVLGLFIVGVTTAASFAINAYDNRVTRSLASIRAGQMPIGI